MDPDRNVLEAALLGRPPLAWSVISKCPEISLEFIETHPELPWEPESLLERSDMTPEFIIRNRRLYSHNQYIYISATFRCLDIHRINESLGKTGYPHWSTNSQMTTELVLLNWAEFSVLHPTGWHNLCANADDPEDMQERLEMMRIDSLGGIFMNPRLTESTLQKYNSHVHGTTINIASLSPETVILLADRPGIQFIGVSESRISAEICAKIQYKAFDYDLASCQQVRTLDILVNLPKCKLQHSCNVTLENMLLVFSNRYDQFDMFHAMPADLIATYWHYFGKRRDKHSDAVKWLMAYTVAEYGMLPFFPLKTDRIRMLSNGGIGNYPGSVDDESDRNAGVHSG